MTVFIDYFLWDISTGLLFLRLQESVETRLLASLEPSSLLLGEIPATAQEAVFRLPPDLGDSFTLVLRAPGRADFLHSHSFAAGPELAPVQVECSARVTPTAPVSVQIRFNLSSWATVEARLFEWRAGAAISIWHQREHSHRDSLSLRRAACDRRLELLLTPFAADGAQGPSALLRLEPPRPQIRVGFRHVDDDTPFLRIEVDASVCEPPPRGNVCWHRLNTGRTNTYVLNWNAEGQAVVDLTGIELRDRASVHLHLPPGPTQPRLVSEIRVGGQRESISPALDGQSVECLYLGEASVLHLRAPE